MRIAVAVVDAYLSGLALTVALVVYPSFRLVGENEWTDYHRAHVRRITWAVGPVWALEGVLSVAWAWRGPHHLAALIHLAVVGLAVLVTAGGAVPRHQRLERARADRDIVLLERWNWVRTVAWILATVIALFAN